MLVAWAGGWRVGTGDRGKGERVRERREGAEGVINEG
jgi:hypothetical protein